jgi:hypothetical protein
MARILADPTAGPELGDAEATQAGSRTSPQERRVSATAANSGALKMDSWVVSGPNRCNFISQQGLGLGGGGSALM